MHPVLQLPLHLAARGGIHPAPPWVSALILTVSLVLAAVALWLGLRVKKRLATALRADGEVIGFREHPHGRHVMKAPILRFTADDGKSHVANSELYSHPPAFELGAKVQVVYSPGKPQEAEYVSLFAQWGIVMILGGMGAMAGIIGIAFRSS